MIHATTKESELASTRALAAPGQVGTPKPVSSPGSGLTKGLEFEFFVVDRDLRGLPLAGEISSVLDWIDVEPDARLVELRTEPGLCADEVFAEVRRRVEMLSSWIRQEHAAQLLPAAALPFERLTEFHRTKPDDDYHSTIEATHGAAVTTAGVHIHLGISAEQDLFRALAVLQMEANSLLALTAASPFCDGRLSGRMSQRWHQFPRWPQEQPMFEDTGHYAAWTEASMAREEMACERHHWGAVRPHGEHRPYDLNRIEVRICDSQLDLAPLRAAVDLAEALVVESVNDKRFDPRTATPSHLLPALSSAAVASEERVATAGLSAMVYDWSQRKLVPVRSRIREHVLRLQRAGYLEAEAADRIKRIVRRGSLAELWARKYREGAPIAELMLTPEPSV